MASRVAVSDSLIEGVLGSILDFGPAPILDKDALLLEKLLERWKADSMLTFSSLCIAFSVGLAGGDDTARWEVSRVVNDLVGLRTRCPSLSSNPLFLSIPSHNREVYSGCCFICATSSLSPSRCSDELGNDSGRTLRVEVDEFDEEGSPELVVKFSLSQELQRLVHTQFFRVRFWSRLGDIV